MSRTIESQREVSPWVKMFLVLAGLLVVGLTMWQTLAIFGLLIAIILAVVLLVGSGFGVIYLYQRFVVRAQIENEMEREKKDFQRMLTAGLGIASQDPSANVRVQELPQGGRTYEIIRTLPTHGRSSRVTAVREIEEPTQQKALPAPLPTDVSYEEIRPQVPQGHFLVGVGRRGIETKEEENGNLVWIVGLSGTGKTSTTTLRVEERHVAGHKFIGVDPHWFKPDSLTNAVRAYASDFLMPMAQSAEETTEVLNAFLTEFNARKGGKVPQPWQPITLLIDEVNAIMDPTMPEEEINKKLLPSIARICGQEGRNFKMGGIFISQQATGLAWLRKVSLMVIVHQLLMESEKVLACNGDSAVAEEMKMWPVGRTYVYGVGFTDGPRTVQQPFFQPQIVEADPSSGPVPEIARNSTLRVVEPNGEPGGTVQEEIHPDLTFALKKRMREIGKLAKEGKTRPEIIALYGSPKGREGVELGAFVDMAIREQNERERDGESQL